MRCKYLGLFLRYLGVVYTKDNNLFFSDLDMSKDPSIKGSTRASCNGFYKDI